MYYSIVITEIDDDDDVVEERELKSGDCPDTAYVESLVKEMGANWGSDELGIWRNETSVAIIMGKAFSDDTKTWHDFSSTIVFK